MTSVRPEAPVGRSLEAKIVVGVGVVFAASAVVGIDSYLHAGSLNTVLLFSILTGLVSALVLLAVLIHRDIARGNRTEQAWRESEERFHQISANLRDILWVLSPDDPHSLYVSAAYEKITGRSAKSLYDSPSSFLEAIHPADRKRADQIFAAQMRGELGSKHEYRIVRPDGSVRWLATRAFAVRQEGGELRRVVGITEDVTERKEAEEALHQSELQFRLVLECAKDLGVITLDPGGHIVSWNEAAKRIKGYRAEEIIGKHFSCFFPKEDVDRGVPAQQLERAAAEGRSEDEGWRVRKDGSRFWASEVTTALRDEAGKLQGFGWVGRDSTERKLVEEAMREGERRYRLLFERNLAGVCLSAPDGRIVNCNEAFAQIFGFASRTELLTRTVWDLYFDPTERTAVRTKLKEAGSLSGIEFRARRKDGSPVWLVGSAALVPNEDGTQYLTQGTIIDITRRKEAEFFHQALLRISEKLNSTLEVDELMDFLVIEAIDLAHAEGGCSGLRTPKGMVCHKTRHQSEIVPLKYCWPPGEGTPGWVLVNKLPYLSNDVETDGQTIRALRERFGVRSLITTPLLDARGEVIGFFEVHNKKDGTGFTPTDQANLLAVSQVASAAIQNALAYQRVHQAEENLRYLSGRLLRSQDEERSRLARELHDSTAQSLAALVINLTRLADSVAEGDRRTEDLISDSLALAELCAREVRTFSYLLHPPLLDEIGLGGALRQYVDGFVQRSGVRVNLDLPAGVGRLSQEVSTTLFRIAQESLTNIHKHSGSATADIRLVRSNGELTLEVRDRGRGIPCGTIDDVNGGFRGLGVGIAGMQERVRQLGGRLEIESGQEGTTVKATLPLRRR